jgi:hypothetical protein
MTFKHVKFEDSPTMRALEKVAKEKGLVKSESLKKEASAKTSLTPTGSLMENIFKLSSGLREKGMVKEASELEMHYFNYKRAQTLYETSKEKGEDLVDAAHPKGSHKLEGVEGNEAVIETILDNHLKALKMVEKHPTGKFGTSAEVIGAVRKVLGQQTLGQYGISLTQNAPHFAEPIVLPDGSKANAAFIDNLKSIVGQSAYFVSGFEFVKGAVEQDSRVPNQKAILDKIKSMTQASMGMYQAMNAGVTAAAQKAHGLEDQRMQSEAYRNDPNYALVAWSEVSQSFTKMGSEMAGADSFLSARRVLADGIIKYGNLHVQSLMQLKQFITDKAPDLKGIADMIQKAIDDKFKVALSNAQYYKG